MIPDDRRLVAQRRVVLARLIGDVTSIDRLDHGASHWSVRIGGIGKALLLTMEQVTRVARDAARETSADFQVAAVLLGRRLTVTT